MTKPANDQANALAEKLTAPPAERGPTLEDLLRDFTPRINDSIPAQVKVTPEQIIQNTLSVVSQTTGLMECAPETILAGVLTGSSLGLQFGPLGHAYLVPRYDRNWGCKVASFQLGYKGMVVLASRSPGVEAVGAHVFHARDEIRVELGSDPEVIHRPVLFDKGGLLGAYAYAKLAGGHVLPDVMNTEDLNRIRDEHRADSKRQNGPWTTDYEQMCRKTVLRRLFNYLPVGDASVAALVAADGQAMSLSPDMLNEAAARAVEAREADIVEAEEEDPTTDNTED